MAKPTTGLRFAALPRVSTEQQADEGESLRVQREDAEQDVKQLVGRIVAWYGGQEHATPGWEKKEIDRLIADAGRDVYDAVWVDHTDRWSRDNRKSEEGLEAFRQHGIRFFVRTRESDLFDEDEVFRLELDAVVFKRQARIQNRKSVKSRIHRAKRGLPACGKLPFGRTFDPKTEQWGTDRRKKALIEDVARRYLAGEPLPKLAEEYGVNPSNLHKVLTRCSGTEWVQEFCSKALNIHEKVVTKVPALLDAETILAIRQRVEANKTYTHGQSVHEYLLGRMVFCAACGSAMFGQTNPNGHRYYRHGKGQCQNETARHCPVRPRPWVNADDLEDAVIRDLFSTFGNPVAVQRAVEAATPDREQVNELRERKERIEAELAKIEESRNRVVRFISRGSLTEEQAEKELAELKGREATLGQELATLDATMANVLTPEAIKAAAEQVSARFGKFRRVVGARARAVTSCINHDFDGMTPEEMRALAGMVFGGKTPEGKRMGVYIERVEGQEARRRKAWRYRIVGHLIDDWGRSPKPPFEPWDPEDGEFLGGPCQGQMLGEVTKSASC